MKDGPDPLWFRSFFIIVQWKGSINLWGMEEDNGERPAAWGRPYENAETGPVNAVGPATSAARGRPLAACLIRHGFAVPPSPKGEGFEMASPCLPL